MKYLSGVFFLMLANIASAVDCRVNGGFWLDVEVGGSLGLNVWTNVAFNASLDRVLLDGYTLECRHRASASSNPSLKIQPATNIGVVLWPTVSHLQGGLRVGSNDSPIPVWSGQYLAVLGREPLVATSVLGRPYLKRPTTAGSYINIASGVGLATVNLVLHFSNNAGSKTLNLPIYVRSNNALNLSPSTCTINNNNPIVVDFGSVDPLAVGGDISSGTPYRKSVPLNYSCPDAGISSPIDIKLVGTASSFNASALATTNPNLAAGLTRLSLLVAPGSSFRTSISNSSGSDTVLFTLFRKAGSLPAAGPFTASATLVMSVP